MTDPYGDDQMLVFSASIDGGDDLTLVFSWEHRWPYKNAGVGGAQTPPCATKSARPSLMNLGGTKRHRQRKDKRMIDSRVPA